MSKTLVMNFLTEQGKKSSIRFKDISDAVKSEDVIAAMDAIISGNIFSTSSGDLKTKDSAQLIDTSIEEFDLM